jgi:hypothetical protein
LGRVRPTRSASCGLSAIIELPALRARLVPTDFAVAPSHVTSRPDYFALAAGPGISNNVLSRV